MLFPAPVTLTDALRSQALKRVLALSPSVGTADVEAAIPAQIRERAFYSARTPYAGYLADTQRMIAGLVQPDVKITPEGLVPTGPGESMSPAQVRSRMKRHLASLGYQPDPAKRGGLQDLSSDTRVNLIIDTQLKMSRGYGEWRQSQDPVILDAWPADELYRAINRRLERDWQQRWNEARRSLGRRTSATAAMFADGPFVALKNDPIWRAISRFDSPFPPFDFRSGMRRRDVTRARAAELGVIAKDAPPPPPRQDSLNEEIVQDTGNMPAGILQALGKALGAMARIDGGNLIISPFTGV